MEAFGNAKTVRNDNSSRFGKYLEIQFDSSHAPVGGVISTFLLEKTRVSSQQKGERNYHIFYQMLAGLDGSLKSEFGLRDPQSYWYLSQSGTTTVDGVDDRAEFEEVVKAMRTVGFSDSEQACIWGVLSGILNLGNIRFEGEAPAQVKDRTPLTQAARLLMVEPEELHMSLNHRHIQSGSARHTQFAVPQNAEQSAGIRDALSKELYARLFDYIVAKVNASLSAGPSQTVIGVLDIYGFEIFECNSFEQFCINYVNERLQQIFIDLTVRGEQAEYHDEGLKWKDIAFFDNKVVLELIEGRSPPGLFRLLDDTCKTVHSLESQVVDGKFMEKVIKTHASHPHFYCPAQGSDARQFTVKHYAGDVEYTVHEFSTKNNDNMYISLVSCMQGSTNPFIVALFPEDLQDDKRTPTTAGFKIRNSANYLVKRLSDTTPHYIRCIKPNDKKQVMTFNFGRVEHQVKYLGLLENIKVKRAGYAYRHYKDVFLRRFGQLMDQPPNNIQEFVAFVGRKYSDISADEFEEGKTKIFVRSPETIWLLEDRLFQKVDPEGYKDRLKAFKENEKLAKAKEGSHSLKPRCLLQ